VEKLALLVLSMCRLVRFANVLFCAWAVHFIVFFCLHVANCPLCRFLHLPLTFDNMASEGLRAISYQVA